jgi:SAM-dependent methyltransferase
MADWSGVLAQTADYYGSKVRAYGARPQGVDWSSDEAQRRRFDQFGRLFDAGGEISINDYGCGYGGLVEWLDRRERPYRYVGLDISADMIALARAAHGGRACCRFTTDPGEVSPADYTVASGVFNVKLDTPAAEWATYVFDTIDRLADLSRRGFAFNMLTLDSDPDRRRPGLFYADPADIFSRCRTRYGRAAAVLQDYGLYDFTVIVRKDGAPA